MKVDASGYYDDHALDRLRDFVSGNPRIERAWRTAAARWADSSPARILEIGCGIGGVCFRLSRRWPSADVVGLDLSARSVAIAERLFGAPKVRFVAGRLHEQRLAGPFDVMMLMDVYEHVARDERSHLHAALGCALSDRGRVFLAFPTPRHLAWLRVNAPQQIQPVDEDIDVATMRRCAEETGTELLYYEEVDIWNRGDYAYAELGRRGPWSPAAPRHGRISRLLSQAWRRRAERLPSEAWRLNLVKVKLGIDPRLGKR